MSAPALNLNAALRVMAEALPVGSAVPVPRDDLLRLLDCPAATPVVEEEDRLLSAEEVAARLGMSKEWVYKNAKRLPFTRRIGTRALRFSAKGLERWQARRMNEREAR